jgi:hypothetical protein
MGWRRAGPHHYEECPPGDREDVQHPSGPGGGQVRVWPRAGNHLQSGHFCMEEFGRMHVIRSRLGITNTACQGYTVPAG